jgi:hypothetical protein
MAATDEPLPFFKCDFNNFIAPPTEQNVLVAFCPRFVVKMCGVSLRGKFLPEQWENTTIFELGRITRKMSQKEAKQRDWK